MLLAKNFLSYFLAKSKLWNKRRREYSKMIQAINYSQQPQQNIAFRGLQKENLLQLSQENKSNTNKISFKEMPEMEVFAKWLARIGALAGCIGGAIIGAKQAHGSMLEHIGNGALGGLLGGVGGGIAGALLPTAASLVAFVCFACLSPLIALGSCIFGKKN